MGIFDELFNFGGGRRQSNADDRAAHRVQDTTNRMVGRLGGYMAGGVGDWNNYNAMLNNPGAFQHSPGFGWALQQGLNGLNSRASANGMLNSGNQMKDLIDYAHGLASQDYQNQLNNYMRGAQFGLGATQGVNAYDQANTGAVNSLYGQGARARTQGDMAGASNFFGGMGALAGGMAGRQAGNNQNLGVLLKMLMG